MNNKKLKVAITGGIGSGKSYIAELYKNEGYEVIYADQLAKDILKNNPTVREKIKKEFGIKAYIGDEPDTHYLAEKVFSDPGNVAKINAILHPATIDAINKLSDKILQEHDIVFIEAALIFEADMQDMFDYIILITSDEQKRIERIKKRDGLSKEEILKRMQNQLPDNFKKAKSDFIIENNSNLEEFGEKALFVLHILKSLISS